jgi:hypothetical protein
LFVAGSKLPMTLALSAVSPESVVRNVSKPSVAGSDYFVGIFAHGHTRDHLKRARVNDGEHVIGLRQRKQRNTRRWRGNPQTRTA